MRISTRQSFLSSVDNMQNSQSKLADLQNQISTGKKLNKPSDDPVAAAQVVKLNRELAQIEKYQDNIDVTQRRLALEETILDSINIAVDRMRELTLQAANGVLGDADRNVLATELRGLVDYTAGLMNTRDAQGEYLFSGSQGFIQPYQQDGEGNYGYQGDDGQRMIQVASQLYVPSNDSGQYLFEAVSEAVVVDVLPASTSFISELEVVDEELFSEFSKGKGDLQLEVQFAPEGSSVTPAYQYQLKDSSGAVVEGPVALRNIAAGETITAHGLAFTLREPAGTALVIEQQVAGVKELTVADIAVAQAFVEQYSQDPETVSLEFNKTAGTYSLKDSADGLIAINGETTFSYTENEDLLVGGFRLALAAPENGDRLTLDLPLPALSPVSNIEVSDVDNYAALANGIGELQLSFTSATTFDFEGSSYTFTPPTIDLEALAGAGLSLTVDDTLAGNEVITLKEPARVTAVLQTRTERLNVLDVASTLATVLETPVADESAREAMNTAMAKALDQLSAVAERNLEARTAIGSRINSLENTQTSNEDFKLYTQTTLSGIEDVDFARAVSELTLEEAVLQAAQATFVKIQELSLFNFIR
ncbi:MAG: flagellar hook-associated protein FlgL [Pontibacterium sp.]